MANLSGKDNLGNCTAQQDTETHIDNIFKYAQDAGSFQTIPKYSIILIVILGKSTGIVTNTRITHATPAAAFARIANRDWEGNAGVPAGCEDIAQQLIWGEIGSKIDVALGGGRGNFQPNTTRDREGNKGLRTDGKNLLDEYIRIKKRQGKRPAIVQTAVPNYCI